MFKKILFATTASPVCDDAAKVAFDLAKKYNAQLYVLHVYGMPTRGFSTFVTDMRSGQTEELDSEYESWVVEEMKNTYEKQIKDLPGAQLVTRVGIPSTEILRFARSEGIDLMVMGAHARQEDPGAARYRNITGSTMRKVTKSARCPVLIISRPCTTCWWYFSNIIFGTDFSKAADQAFQFALKVAREIGCKLYLFHAVDIGADMAGRVQDQRDIEKLIEKAKYKMKDLYISHMGDFDNYEIEIWEGIPYVEVLKYAREKQGDLIVMAHHARDVDPEEAELGSTVEQVVLRASCPVASVSRAPKGEAPAA
jgi:nucleotide-binding universal stress UspA family protein